MTTESVLVIDFSEVLPSIDQRQPLLTRSLGHRPQELIETLETVGERHVTTTNASSTDHSTKKLDMNQNSEQSAAEETIIQVSSKATTAPIVVEEKEVQVVYKDTTAVCKETTETSVIKSTVEIISTGTTTSSLVEETKAQIVSKETTETSVMKSTVEIISKETTASSLVEDTKVQIVSKDTTALNIVEDTLTPIVVENKVVQFHCKEPTAQMMSILENTTAQIEAEETIVEFTPTKSSVVMSTVQIIPKETTELISVSEYSTAPIVAEEKCIHLVSKGTTTSNKVEFIRPTPSPIDLEETMIVYKADTTYTMEPIVVEETKVTKETTLTSSLSSETTGKDSKGDHIRGNSSGSDDAASSTSVVVVDTSNATHSVAPDQIGEQVILVSSASQMEMNTHQTRSVECNEQADHAKRDRPLLIDGCSTETSVVLTNNTTSTVSTDHAQHHLGAVIDNKDSTVIGGLQSDKSRSETKTSADDEKFVSEGDHLVKPGAYGKTSSGVVQDTEVSVDVNASKDSLQVEKQLEDMNEEEAIERIDHLKEVSKQLRAAIEDAKVIGEEIEESSRSINQVNQHHHTTKKMDHRHSGQKIHGDHEEQTSVDPKGASTSTASKQSRSEKKARKAISKMGLKPVTGINRVTILRKKSVALVISYPDVFVNSSNDTYIIFGEARVDDADERSKQEALRHITRSDDVVRSLSKNTPEDASVDAQADDETVDEAGIDLKDIELVMSQASVSRSRAIRALKDNGNDIVNAIMALTV